MVQTAIELKGVMKSGLLSASYLQEGTQVGSTG